MFVVESKTIIEQLIRVPYIRYGSRHISGKQWVVCFPTEGSKLEITSTGIAEITIPKTGYCHFFGSPFLKAFELWLFLLSARSIHDFCYLNLTRD